MTKLFLKEYSSAMFKRKVLLGAWGDGYGKRNLENWQNN